MNKKYGELVGERLRTGLDKNSGSYYSCQFFYVLNQNRILRVLHDFQELNKVTIEYAGLPPAPEYFVEDFLSRGCYGLGCIMGEDHERNLAEKSRTLTAFETPLGRF